MVFTLGNPPLSLLARACINWRSCYGIKDVSLSSLETGQGFLPWITNSIAPGQLLLQFLSSGCSAAYMREACLFPGETGQELAVKSLLLQALLGPLLAVLERPGSRWVGG